MRNEHDGRECCVEKDNGILQDKVMLSHTSGILTVQCMGGVRFS